MSQLQAAVQQANTEITISGSFGGQSGNVTVSAPHVRIIANNGVTINGNVNFVNDRQHWSGGNINGNFVCDNGPNPIFDIIWDDVNVVTTNSVDIGSVEARMVIMNSTFLNDRSSIGWGLYSSAGRRRSDLLVANVKQISNPGTQTQRLQNWDRLIMIDGANYDRGRDNAFRMHYNCQPVWFADYIVGPGGFTISGVGTTVQIGATDIIAERINAYGGLTQMIVDCELGSGTNIQRNTVLNSSNGNVTQEGPQSVSSGFSNGGGNLVRPWNGVDPVENALIGAQR